MHSVSVAGLPSTTTGRCERANHIFAKNRSHVNHSLVGGARVKTPGMSMTNTASTLADCWQ